MADSNIIERGLGRLRRQNQHVYITTGNNISIELSGVQSAQASYELNQVPLKFLGMNADTPVVFKGAQQSNVSISQYIINQDILYPLATGLNGFNGFILTEKSNITDNFSFISGYVSSYSQRNSIGSVPEINTNITVYNNIGRLNTGDEPQSSQLAYVSTGNVGYGGLNVTAPGTIDLALGTYSTNRILSYEISLNSNRIPIYSLGNRKPIAVYIDYPIEVNLNFEFEFNDYEFHNFESTICNNTFENVSIKLRDYQNTGTIVAQYDFNNVFLFSENYSLNANGNLVGNLNYRTYINKPI